MPIRYGIDVTMSNIRQLGINQDRTPNIVHPTVTVIKRYAMT